MNQWWEWTSKRASFALSIFVDHERGRGASQKRNGFSGWEPGGWIEDGRDETWWFWVPLEDLAVANVMRNSARGLRERVCKKTRVTPQPVVRRRKWERTKYLETYTAQQTELKPHTKKPLLLRCKYTHTIYINILLSKKSLEAALRIYTYIYVLELFCLARYIPRGFWLRERNKLMLSEQRLSAYKFKHITWACVHHSGKFARCS